MNEKQKRRDLKTGRETEHEDFLPCTKCGGEDDLFACWDDEAWCVMCVFRDVRDARKRREDQGSDADVRRP